MYTRIHSLLGLPPAPCFTMFWLQSSDLLLFPSVVSLCLPSLPFDCGLQERPRSKAQRSSGTSSGLDREWGCQAWPPTWTSLPGHTFISPLSGKDLRHCGHSYVVKSSHYVSKLSLFRYGHWDQSGLRIVQSHGPLCFHSLSLFLIGG